MNNVSKIYGKKEIIAGEQPFEFLSGVKNYLQENGVNLSEDCYFVDNENLAGVFYLTQNILIAQDGVKTEIGLEITAKKENLKGLVKKALEVFPQFKEKII